MNLNQHVDDSDLKIDMSPMIDMVFLLLIYFMVSASLIRKEADIGFMLPADIAVENMQEIPVEVLIEITVDGTVLVEGMRFAGDDHELKTLVSQVAGLKAIAISQRSPFFVNVLPHQDSLHSRIIDVMDACAAAGVNSLTFSKSM